MMRKIAATVAIAAGMVLAGSAVATAADGLATGSAGPLGAFIVNIGTGLSSTQDWPPNGYPAQPVDDAGVGTGSSDILFGLLATYLGIDRPGSVA